MQLSLAPVAGLQVPHDLPDLLVIPDTARLHPAQLSHVTLVHEDDSSPMSLWFMKMTRSPPVLLAAPLLPALPPVLVVGDGRVKVGQVSLGAGEGYNCIVSDTVLPPSAAGQILPKCRYYASILFPKMRVKSIKNAGI